MSDFYTFILLEGALSLEGYDSRKTRFRAYNISLKDLTNPHDISREAKMHRSLHILLQEIFDDWRKSKSIELPNQESREDQFEFEANWIYQQNYFDDFGNLELWLQGLEKNEFKKVIYAISGWGKEDWFNCLPDGDEKQEEFPYHERKAFEMFYGGKLSDYADLLGVSKGEWEYYESGNKITKAGLSTSVEEANEKARNLNLPVKFTKDCYFTLFVTFQGDEKAIYLLESHWKLIKKGVRFEISRPGDTISRCTLTWIFNPDKACFLSIYVTELYSSEESEVTGDLSYDFQLNELDIRPDLGHFGG